MRVYLDSSALIKRAIGETESEALETALESYFAGGSALVSSSLAWIEVTRGIRSRLDSESPIEVAELIESTLAGITECPMSEQVVGIARRLGPSSLRSLDAIHLATATLVNADVICAYDRRLLSAASELGFRTVSPGVPAHT